MSYTSYVDAYSDLASTWTKIEDTSSAEYRFWNPMGATTKEEFGRLHWTKYGSKNDKRSLTKGDSVATGTATTTTTATTPVSTPPEAPTYTTSQGQDPVNEVMYAQNAVAGMPKLTAPPKITAPAQQTVKPQELVEWRMTQMMKQTSPYTQQAITQAKQWANESGMLNTSIASTVGVDAAIKSILPIAQQDAATLSTQALTNQKTVNEFLMQDFLTKSQFKLTEFGHMANTYNQGLQQAHVKNESEVQRKWQGEQGEHDRELTIWRDKHNAYTQEEIANSGANATCVQNAMDRWAANVASIDSQRSSMSPEDYRLQIINAAKVRDHQKSMC
jgi:hypothetical protein